MTARQSAGPRVEPARLTLLLVVVMMAGSFLNSATSVLGPFISRDLDLSRAELGALTTTMYLVAVVGAPILGGLVDRRGAERAVPLLFLGQAAAVLVVVVTRSYVGALVGLALAGLPLAASNPVTNSLIGSYASPARHGLLLGIKQSGGQVMWLVSGLIVAPVGGLFGWRWATTVGLLLCVAGAFVFRGVPELRGLPRQRHTRVRVSGERRPYVSLAAFSFLMTVSSSSVSNYLPLYGHERVGLGLGAAGSVVALLGLPGVIARVSWGRAADRIGSCDRVLAVLAVASIVGVGLLAAADRGGVAFLLVGAVVFGATSGAWPAVAMLAILRSAPAGRTGMASGVMLIGGHSALVVAPTVFGAIVDAGDGSYSSGWTFDVVALGLAATVAAHRWRREVRKKEMIIKIDSHELPLHHG